MSLPMERHTLFGISFQTILFNYGYEESRWCTGPEHLFILFCPFFFFFFLRETGGAPPLLGFY
jgi:hypothetical protein